MALRQMNELGATLRKKEEGKEGGRAEMDVEERERKNDNNEEKEG